MKHRYNYLQGIALLIFASAVVCYSFAGEKKLTLTESKTAYIAADKKLNAVWKQIKNKLNHDPQRLESLRYKQRRWIGYRDYFAGKVLMRNHKIPANKLKQSPKHWQTMTYLTQERTEILKSILSSFKKPLPKTGEWTDGFGGYMKIAELDNGKIVFQIIVCRGPTHHTGVLAGIAEINGKILRFTDATTTKHKEKEAWLTGIFRSDHLEIITASAQHYCGARAYFDGEYYRVGDLTEKQKKELIKQASKFPNAY